MNIKGFIAIIILGGIGLYFLVTMKEKEVKGVQTTIQAFDRTKVKLTQTNMETIKRAVLMHIAETGNVPNSLKELKSNLPTGGIYQDAWGIDIKIERISSDKFKLISAGGDHKFQTEDDIIIEY